jgi:hypothetical protein
MVNTSSCIENGRARLAADAPPSASTRRMKAVSTIQLFVNIVSKAVKTLANAQRATTFNASMLGEGEPGGSPDNALAETRSTETALSDALRQLVELRACTAQLTQDNHAYKAVSRPRSTKSCSQHAIADSGGAVLCTGIPYAAPSLASDGPDARPRGKHHHRRSGAMKELDFAREHQRDAVQGT